MNQSKVMGLLSISITVIFWGGAFILRDILLDYINPIALVFFQSLLSTIFLFFYNVIKKKSFLLSFKLFCRIGISGIVGISFYQIAMCIGISQVGSTISSVFVGLTPFVCLIAEIIIYKKKLTLLSIVSVLLSFAGIFTLVYQKNFQADFHLWGYVILLFSLIAWVIYCFISEKIPDSLDSTVLLFYQLGTATLVTMPFLILYPISISVLFLSQVYLSLTALAILNGIVSYIFFLFALKTIGVVITNIMTNLVPIITLFLNFLFLHTTISLLQLFGILCVITAVIILDYDTKIHTK